MSGYNKMTEEERAEARERCEAAEFGPWGVDISQAKTHGGGYENCKVRARDGFHVARNIYESDAQFIAHARQDLPKALDTIDILEGELAEADEMMDDLVEENRRLKAAVKLLQENWPSDVPPEVDGV